MIRAPGRAFRAVSNGLADIGLTRRGQDRRAIAPLIHLLDRPTRIVLGAEIKRDAMAATPAWPRAAELAPAHAGTVKVTSSFRWTAAPDGASLTSGSMRCPSSSFTCPARCYPAGLSFCAVDTPPAEEGGFCRKRRGNPPA